MQWHQLDHMQTIYTSLQTDNHTKTSLDFDMPYAFPGTQPTVSKQLLWFSLLHESLKDRAELGPALTSELLRLIDKTPKSFVKNKSVALRYTYLTALIYSSLSVILCSNLCTFILGIGCRCLYRQNSSHAQKAELPSSAESSPVKQWQLLSAVCLERLPQITTPMNSIETRVSAMLLDVENENSSLSDHELRHLDDL